MIHISGRRASSVAGWLLLGLGCLPAAGLGARVPDLYAATVPAGDGSAAATASAFSEALRRVLVKVAGREAAAEPGVVARFGDAGALVQQFRRDPAGNLWAQFDAAAVRRGLAAAGLPAWSDERPATLLWLAYDDGAGGRDIVGAGSETGAAGALRRELLEAAASRGVPVVLPLRDSQDMAAISAADLWGEFPEPLRRASARYAADVTLVGRASLSGAAGADVRWTLHVGGERTEWRGGVADGPRGLAERLAERLAGRPAESGSVGLQVSGLRTLDQYGALLAYLGSLDVVEAVGVTGIAGDTLRLELRLRGDRERLDRALAVRRVLEPEAGTAPGEALPRYRLAGQP